MTDEQPPSPSTPPEGAISFICHDPGEIHAILYSLGKIAERVLNQVVKRVPENSHLARLMLAQAERYDPFPA